MQKHEWSFPSFSFPFCSSSLERSSRREIPNGPCGSAIVGAHPMPFFLPPWPSRHVPLACNDYMHAALAHGNEEQP